LCKDLACLREELARVEALGGEGLMLRQPGSRYEAGRSATLLKVKTFRDAEAVVVAHQDGAGTHKGRLGALLVRLPNGIEFSVGTGFSDRERSAPPAVGAVVTFRYQELSEAGVPRFPSYVGERIDVAAPRQSEKAVPVKVKTAGDKRPATPTPADAAPAAPAGARYFEFTGGTSNKFWEVSLSGADLTTRRHVAEDHQRPGRGGERGGVDDQPLVAERQGRPRHRALHLGDPCQAGIVEVEAVQLAMDAAIFGHPDRVEMSGERRRQGALAGALRPVQADRAGEIRPDRRRDRTRRSVRRPRRCR
jgi:hypothetical protein